MSSAVLYHTLSVILGQVFHRPLRLFELERAEMVPDSLQRRVLSGSLVVGTPFLSYSPDHGLQVRAKITVLLFGPTEAVIPPLALLLQEHSIGDTNVINGCSLD
jgi:hypothetical protein